ncbi:hypothetical protein LTR10_015349 [Elasticomyces elasticus]|uniref:BZIP domain-containing protein n=1 Tax=Exophiala sideris TaxID=1016849 RepID=A0ABR0JK24_9EURO|nr:hypothetical protein LTR10_015349 [Elasticomyces elasticus]KAK5030250.1 hypothetical protein LTR13_008269 [Exophiala sideris]KAK5035094.1 hypothetical protein LTS07_002529 [Exophiala sideris]KAK5066017.1 hypothetical protein LTR69_002534 [Exophiala sideris]KAK5178315.1 hypothetical protein LTR44_009191 [Eurotiomycetes sp. CCFEE 6388]
MASTSTQSTIVFQRRMAREARSAEDDWAGLSEIKLRKKIQNRLNQRSYRRRRSEQREADRARKRSGACVKHKRVPITLAPHPMQERTQAKTQTVVLDCPLICSDQGSCISETEASVDLSCIDTKLLIPACRPKQIDSPFGGCAIILLDHDVRRVHHYACSVLWPSFGHHIISTDETLTSAFFRLSMTDELLLNTFVWTAAVEMSLHDNTATTMQKNKAVMLSCQTKAVETVREQIEQGSVTDAVIFAVLALAISDTEPVPMAQEESCYGGFDPPLRSLGWLDYLSRLRWTRSHLDVLKRLVAARGGLDNIETPGIAEQTQSTDILQSSLVLSRPTFALCSSYRHVLEHQVKWVRPPRERAAHFDIVDDDFKNLLLDMRMYCRHFERSDRSNYENLASWETNVYRNLIQFRLLLLPKTDGNTELCRLTALIFSYGVIYPLACPDPLKLLVRQLKDAVSEAVTVMHEAAEFLLWVCVIGGMATSNSENGSYFVAKLKLLFSRLGVPNFAQLKEVLQRYIWLSSACDSGALALANQVEPAAFGLEV